MQYRTSKFIEIVLFLPSGHFFFDGRGKISKKRKQTAAGYRGGGGVLRDKKDRDDRRKS